MCKYRVRRRTELLVNAACGSENLVCEEPFILTRLFLRLSAVALTGIVTVGHFGMADRQPLCIQQTSSSHNGKLSALGGVRRKRNWLRLFIDAPVRCLGGWLARRLQ